ncbi:helix-turn-helix domain-containing protein [Salinibacter altiplanensis]|uniref:helix-turn-helix domain-containing protein n=1 Tax=Salinibacter altiplanensis TaxID=1803181 RepID=UPI000C9FD2E2|nr:helix-turn-helix transcriptional regulator [Salinibacter altiplanensis]
MSSSSAEPTFGERLYSAMEQAGLNNTDVATEVGVSDKTIGRYLNRSEPPSLDRKKTEKTVKALAELLDVRLDWLLSGERPVRRDTTDENSSPREQSFQVPDSFHKVPVAEVITGPDQKLHLDPVETGFFASKDYLQSRYGVRSEKLCLMHVTGDGMRGILEPGQQVVLARWDGEALRDGVIYCLQGPGGLMLRRLRLGLREEEDVIGIQSSNEEVENQWRSTEEFERKYRPLGWVLESRRSL